MKRRSNTVNEKTTAALRKPNRTTKQPLKYWDVAESFYKHSRLKGLSPDTLRYYEKELKQNGRAFTELSAPVENIRLMTAEHIEQLIEYYQRIHRAPRTINSRLRALRTFFAYCVSKGITVNNPVQNIANLKVRHEVGATFSRQQLQRLLDAPKTDTFSGLRDLAIMTTLAHTGIRLKELTSLRLPDISFDGIGAITVQRTKNRYARRIPMTKQLRLVLTLYIEERGILDTDILFVSIDNAPFAERSIQYQLKYYGKISGVGNYVSVSPHAFRRTFCRLKVEAGTNLFLLQRLTGHSKLDMLRRYVQIFATDLITI